MKLYDETIRKVRALLSSEKQQLPHDATAWPSVSDRSMPPSLSKTGETLRYRNK